MEKSLNMIKEYGVPTGHIVTCRGEKGLLELVSVGDYGKDINLKADFLGQTEAPKPFNHAPIMPLTEKWVITISTQYGCSMNCKFCDVPKVGPGKSCTFADMKGQILTGLSLHPEITRTNRLNIHFARMGEPSFAAPAIYQTAAWLNANFAQTHKPHPVVSTMMPNKNRFLRDFIKTWIHIKNHVYQGNAGLQLSINSTNEDERKYMFSGNAMKLDNIAMMMDKMEAPLGRKITLNFAVADYEIDAKRLASLFDPDRFLCKLTPMHKTNECLRYGIATNSEVYTSYHPYEKYEADLKEAGFDVIVFLASEMEDLGRITCGNAILSGTKPEVDHSLVVHQI